VVTKYFPFFQDYHLFIFQTQMQMHQQILDQTSVFSNLLLSKIRKWRAFVAVDFCREIVLPAAEAKLKELKSHLDKATAPEDSEEFLARLG
jgi:hypothetical protein